MKLSRFFSIILHPIFIPFLTLYISILKLPNILILNYQIKIIFLIAFLFTIFFPLINIFFFILLKKVKTLELELLSERLLVLCCTIIWFVIGFFLLKDMLFYSPILKRIYLGSIFIMSLAMIVSKKWKISLHMIGISGACGTFISLGLLYGGFQDLIITSILLSGVLGYSRLKENAHSPQQIYAGFIMGICTMLFTIFYL